jgi:type II secretory pathway component PulF
MSAALGRFLGPSCVAEATLLQAGEESGRLDEALAGMIEDLEGIRQFRLSLVRSLAYPVLLLHLGILFPAVWAGLARGAGAFWASLTLGLLFLWGVPLAIWGLFGRRWASVLPRVPLLGRLLQRSAEIRYLRSLRLLYDAGVPVVRALELAAAALPFPDLRRRADGAARAVRGGAGVSQALLDAFPSPALRAVLHVGENVGDLTGAFRRSEILMSDERNRLARSLSATFRTAAFVVAVGLIGWKVISFYAKQYDQLDSLFR